MSPRTWSVLAAVVALACAARAADPATEAMSEHTPTPWKLGEDAIGDIFDSNNKSIAKTDAWNVGTHRRPVENRANAAKTALVSAGVGASRIRVVSYGKEKQFCTDDTEECWQQNRRAQFSLDR